MTTKKDQQFRNILAGMGAQPEPKAKRSAKPATPKAAGPAKVEAISDQAAEETIQISAYIPKSLHKRVKVAIASQDEKTTLTDLLIKLLDEWTKDQA